MALRMYKRMVSMITGDWILNLRLKSCVLDVFRNTGLKWPSPSAEARSPARVRVSWAAGWFEQFMLLVGEGAAAPRLWLSDAGCPGKCLYSSGPPGGGYAIESSAHKLRALSRSPDQRQRRGPRGAEDLWWKGFSYGGMSGRYWDLELSACLG
jgi:hypothetical protein